MAGCRPAILPGHRRGDRGDAGSRLQSLRGAGDHASGGAARDRQRALRAPDRAARGLRALRPGFRANATIGRAIRLILMNVGGAWPGRHDMATQGSPAKFSYAIAEREDGVPWDAMHVALGFRATRAW